MEYCVRSPVCAKYTRERISESETRGDSEMSFTRTLEIGIKELRNHEVKGSQGTRELSSR